MWKHNYLIRAFIAWLTTSATRGSKASGRIFVSLSSSSGTRFEMARAAASFISSVICVARPSRAPLNMPGKAITLFTWLGKSERPVPTTFAPAAFATSGMISGTGLAIAKEWRLCSLMKPFLL